MKLGNACLQGHARHGPDILRVAGLWAVLALLPPVVIGAEDSLAGLSLEALNSGICLDSQDVVMSDIARIEVISGPGATLWGANAMHGVINIITRPAHLTERIGNDPRGHASLASLMDLGRNQMFDLSVRHREYPAPSGLLIRRAVMAEARWRR